MVFIFIVVISFIFEVGLIFIVDVHMVAAINIKIVTLKIVVHMESDNVLLQKITYKKEIYRHRF
jgi:hypothetical protein